MENFSENSLRCLTICRVLSIKERFIKVLRESIEISTVTFVVIYGLLSIGFTNHSTQVNDSYLFRSCLCYIQRNDELIKNDNSDSGISDEVNPKVGSISAASNGNDIVLDKSKVYEANISFLPDSTQPGSRRLRTTESDSSDTTKLFLSDSARALSKGDSTFKADTLFWDSTARMEQFHYQRKDPVYTEFRPKKRSKFFAYPSQANYTRTITLDSTGNFVEIKEKIANEQTKILLRVPIEEFINSKIKANRRDLWENLIYKYELKSGKKDLSELIADITNIEIPLPSAGFLSIFGPPVINLRIGGAVDIHGAWRSETTEGVTASALGNTRNEPDFKQQVQINVNGTIGDKLTIGADWNTERTFEYENQLKIKYKGYEDEIVQSVEAGNVSLQTSSLVGGSEALFGVKAQFQLGPLNLTALASQKKGEIKEVSISGGSTSNEFEIHAYNYSTNHYFIDQVYADTSAEYNLFKKYYSAATPEIVDSLRIKELEVWKLKTGQRDAVQERQVNAFIDLPAKRKPNLNYDDKRDTVQTEQGIIEANRFIKLSEGTDYTYNPNAGFITFKTQIQETDAIAVAYRREGPTNSNDDDLYFGELIGNDTTTSKRLVLKLVKPGNLRPQDKKAWNLQLKNIYSIGGRDVNEEGFELDIVYSQPGKEDVNQINGKPLLNAFGLDEVGEGGVSGKDGKFDFYNGRTIITSTGEIIFPVRQPFGNDLPSILRSSIDSYKDTLAYMEIYDTTVTFAKQQTSKDRFLLKGKYSASSSSVFNLGYIGVVENSVKVRLAGRELVEGTDFVVDYNVGQVTIKNAAALVPGADLKISYEQNDLFQMASKTLLGLRGEIDFSPKTKLGFSMLNLNQQTLSDKVRIGEEPLDNSIYGVDFGTSLDLPFLTKGLSTIIPSRTMSSLSVKGEFAYINPDPNTKKSTIASDNSESIAYIDDFEGSKRTIPVGLSYTSWHEPSVPDSLPYIADLSKPSQMFYKAKSIWYTHIPTDVEVKEIWPKRQASRQDQQVTVLDYEYWPRTKGMFNWHPKLEEPEKNWGGMMKLLSSTATNLVEENIEFIEFWVRIDHAPSDAKIYIDLGKITEDAIPNGKLDSEDKNENDLIDEGEDLGMDMLSDAQEREAYNSTETDPSGDDYSYSGNQDYTHINGTEGNAVSIDVGKYPDTEDLNRNLNLDELNSYYRYEIKLDTTKYPNSDKFKNPLITGGGISVPWYQFRIPLKDFNTTIGSPSFSLVEFIRVFTHGLSDSLHLRFAEFNLVGSQWQKVIANNNVDDSVLTLSVINVEENSATYSSPPGVQRERDRSKTDEEVLRNEQSLSLIINSLTDNDHREVVKYVRSMDLFNYSEMKLFIHTDSNPLNNISNYTDSANYAAEVYLRFGSDTTNYYEYRMPLRPNSDLSANNWQDISIKFDELTAFKQKRNSISDSSNKTSSFKVPGTDGHYYRFRGSPALTKVAFFMIGIENPKGKGITMPVSGDVWINELRVIGADDTPGWAYTASAKLNVGDLFTVNYNTSQTNANFHKLSDRFGSRLDSKSWGTSVDFDIMKIIPVNLPGSNLKLNYSHNEQSSAPVYQPGTDIKVSAVAEQLRNDGISEDSIKKYVESTKTINVSETWSLSSIKFKIPSNNWFLRDFINNLQFGFNYNKAFGRSPSTAVSKTWQWNGNASYSLNLSPSNFFYPANIPILGTVVELFSDYRNVKIYYLPQSFNWAFTASRNYSYSLARSSTADAMVSQGFKTTRNLGFQWKITEGGLLNLGTSYNFDFSSSLDHLLTDEDKVARSESDIWKDIFTKDFFGRNYQFTQSVDLKTSPKLPSLWDVGKYLTLNFGYGASYSWQNNFTQAELGRSAGVTSKVTASLQFKLKSLFAPLFKEDEKKDQPSTKQTNVRKPNETGTKQPKDQRDRLRQTNIKNDKSKQQNDQAEKTIPPDQKPKSDSLALNKNIKADSLSKLNTAKVDSLLKTNTAKVDSLAKSKAPVDSLSKSTAEADSLEEKEPKVSPFSIAYQTIKASVRWILFDYENIQINFSHDNQIQKSGLKGGGAGLANFWGLIQKDNYGPNRLFMLGLSSDVGPRAVGNLTDNYSQRNNIDLKTQRPLWEGANLELRWKVSWQYSKSVTLKSNEDGSITISNLTSTSSITKSFVSLPPVFFLPFIKDGIENIKSKYKPDKANLTEAFSESFETLPLFSKIPFLKDFAKYVPRPNWSINWDGLEKMSIFKSWAKRVSISHAYTSEYSEGWKIDPDGKQVTQSQKVNYGFSPLLGLNLTFNQLWSGNLSGNIKFGTKTSYDLGVSTNNITETGSKDIGLSASYSKTGFEVPLFGVSLKNDIEVSFSYTYSKNSVINHIMNPYSKVPQDGTVRTTMEPRIKYVISSKVTLSIFYKRSSVTPEGASKISATTTNEAGLDVHISIQ